VSISIGESVCPNWYEDGSTTPIRLDGNATLAAATTYRTYVATSDAEWVTFQWQQSAAGAGTIASQEVRRTLENRIEILDLGDPGIWALTALVFATLPAGANDSDMLDIVDAAATYVQVEFTTGAAPVTGLRFLAQVRR
jgi:hypothetical protein